MKNIMMSAIVLIFISLQANGQQAQDTLYLKNGGKAVGKLQGTTNTEYRFQTSEGLNFIFSPDEVEKIVTTQEMEMRRVNPDTLSIDQLNLKKAVSMQKTGMFLTITGVASVTAGMFIIYSAINSDSGGGFRLLIPLIYGIPSTLAGTTLWALGVRSKKLLSLDINELNLYLDKAVRLRNAGMILTLGGIGMAVPAFLIPSTKSILPLGLGLVSTVVGIPLWATGSGMRAKTELTLQKFNIVPEGSMAVGLGMTIRF
jgi:hypothetical protein